jgi:hypothetical protein
MKNSLNCQQLSMPYTPQASPQCPRPLSYSRSLSRFNPTTSLPAWHLPFQQAEENSSEPQQGWNRTFGSDGRLRKDEMMRILRGRNCMLPAQTDGRLAPHQLTNKKIYRSLLKSRRAAKDPLAPQQSAQVSQANQPIRGAPASAQQKHRSPSHLLGRSLRVEKWLDIAHVLRM